MKKLLQQLTGIFILMFFMNGAWGQTTTIWSEDFSTYNDNSGFIGPDNSTTGDYPASVSKWILNVSGVVLTATTDWFMVNDVSGNLFEARDIDGEGVWISESINIASFVNVEISVSISESGDMESSDYARVYYILDGGAEVLFSTNGDNSDDFSYALAQQTGLNGSSLQIVIRLKNNAGDEYHRFDDIVVEGYSFDPEPTNHPLNFSASANGNTQVDLSWSDNDGTVAAHGFLIVGKTGSGSFYVPVDGTEPANDIDWTDEDFEVKVAHGVQSYSITGLDPSTSYEFKIYAYTNAGTNINYKTDGTIPNDDATTDTPSAAGLAISNINTVTTIDFDNTVSDVNNGQFEGLGFIMSPSLGQLNSGAWAIEGMSDGDLSFTGTQTAGDYARGTSSGNVSTGGIYAFEVSTGNHSLGFQPGGSDFAPGSATLRIENQTGVPINSLLVAYKVYVFNNEDRSSSVNFSHSADHSTYVDIAELNLITPEVSDASPTWKCYYRIAHISGLGISNLSHYYVRWSSNDVGGVDSRDEFAIDDITFIANPISGYSISGTYEELIIGSGAEVVIEPGNELTIDGTLTNNATASDFTIESDAISTGSLLNTTGGVAATVKCYVSQYTSNSDGWHLVSCPLSGVDIASSDWTIGDYDMYRYDEATNYWLNQKDAGNSALFGNYILGVGYLYAKLANVTNRFEGTLNAADVTVSGLTKDAAQGDGWHVLGNPFPSALDWSTGWTLSNIGGTAKVLKADGTGYRDLSAGDDIPTNQGFWVQVSTAPGSVTIPVSACVHSSQAYSAKSTLVDDMTLRLFLDATRNVEYRIKFNTSATDAFDWAYDSHFLAPWGADVPKLYSQVGLDEFVSTNTFNFTGNKSIPLGIEVTSAATFPFMADGVESFSNDVSIILEDTENSMYYDLRQQNTVNVEVLPTDAFGRYVLHFSTVVGVDELNETIDWTAYSHDGALYLNNNGTDAVEASVKVVNMLGQTMFAKDVNVYGMVRFDMDVPAAYYMVQVVSNKQTVTKKVFIQ